MEALVVAMRVMTGVILLDVVLGFVAPASSVARQLTQRLTAPLYRPVRRICDPARVGADFSPMILVMGITALAFVLAPELVGGR